MKEWDWFVELNFYDEKLRKDDFVLNGNINMEGVSLEDYIVKDEDGKPNSILPFNFQLNQLLMLINNPLLFPHRAYVQMFNKNVQEACHE